ncbi:aKG-HExxH-type peptide beta-hydroxylase [Streptomyces sp. NPDC002586]
MGVRENVSKQTSFAGRDVSKFDAILSGGRPFGDSVYVHEQMRSAFKRRIEELGTSMPIAHRLLDSLERADKQSQYRVLGDPVVRAAIQHSLGRIVAGYEVALPLELCEEVFRRTVHHLESGSKDSPSESGAVPTWHLGSVRDTAWIWKPERSDDVFGRGFQQIIVSEYEDLPCSPSVNDIEMLQQATRLLNEILPMVSRSALSHAHLVGIVPGAGSWKDKASSSQFRVTGAIFLNQTLLKNPWWVAEHLLHESLHQKLYDFRHAHSLLARDEEDEENLPSQAARVVSLWNPPGLDASNSWDPNRVVAAFHVYVHLALFCTLAEERAPELKSVYGPLDAHLPMTASRTAFNRAHYLGESLRSTCWSELGLAGQRLVDWLVSILDALDPSPPPPGTFLHLLLDRYLREARKIQRMSLSADLRQNLTELSRVEAASMKEVLSTLGAHSEINNFAVSVAEARNPEEGTAFAEVRHLIAETALRLAGDQYSLKAPSLSAAKSPDEMIRDMVESSSRDLARLIG